MKPSSGYYSKFYSTFTVLQRHKRNKTGGALLGLSILDLFESPDAIDRNIKTVREAESARDGLKTETGMDRVNKIFTRDEYGDISPELAYVLQGGMLGAFIGSVVGGSISSKLSYQNFIDNNKATVFYNTRDAQRRLSDKVYVGYFRGAWIWGWRIGFFSASINLLTTVISVYRDESSIIEYTTAGAITGMLYQFKKGPKPMVAGGVLGGVLGTLAGSIILLTLHIAGATVQDMKYWQYQWKEEYQAEKLKRLEEARERDLDPLLKVHEALIPTDQKNDSNDMLQSLDADKIQNDSTNVAPKHVDETKKLASKIQVEQTNLAPSKPA